MTRDTSVAGCTTSPISVLSDSTQSDQPPPWLPRLARCEMRPSLPTALLMRPNSRTILSFRPMTSFRHSAILPSMPLASVERRAEKSPRRKAFRTFKSSRLSNTSGAAVAAARLFPGYLGVRALLLRTSTDYVPRPLIGDLLKFAKTPSRQGPRSFLSQAPGDNPTAEKG